jgi:hypothetical protein
MIGANPPEPHRVQRGIEQLRVYLDPLCDSEDTRVGRDQVPASVDDDRRIGLVAGQS